MDLDRTYIVSYSATEATTCRGIRRTLLWFSTEQQAGGLVLVAAHVPKKRSAHRLPVRHTRRSPPSWVNSEPWHERVGEERSAGHRPAPRRARLGRRARPGSAAIRRR